MARVDRQKEKEESLLSRLRQGEEKGWDMLFENFSRSIYRWALYFGADESGAEEITQEVFSTAVRRINFCRSDELLPAWLFQITRRQVANYRRSQWFRRVFGGEAGGVAAERGEEEERSGEGGALSIEINQTLKKLPIKYAEILIMHYLEGYSHEEISKFVGIPEGTVASRLSKAKKLFSNLWEKKE